jgi:hypothetical protein
MAADPTAGTAEQVWTNLVAAEEELSETNPPSLDSQQFERFLTEQSQRAGQLADRFKLYRQRYAGGPHALEAWDKWMDLLVQSAYKLPERHRELEKAEQQYLADPKLNVRQRETILNNQVDRARSPEEREKLVRQAMTEVESPTEFFSRHMLSIAEFSEHARATSIVDEILNLKDGVKTPEWYSNHVTAPRTASGWIAGEKGILQYYQAQAQELKRTLERIGHPLRLKFKAFDETIVDVAHFRGRVVLLEFWATWCPPCVAGIPRVRAVWDALHEKGFEVMP